MLYNNNAKMNLIFPSKIDQKGSFNESMGQGVLDSYKDLKKIDSLSIATFLGFIKLLFS